MKESEWKATKKEVERCRKLVEQSKGEAKQLQMQLKKLGYDPSCHTLMYELRKQIKKLEAQLAKATSEFEKEWNHVLAELEEKD